MQLPTISQYCGSVSDPDGLTRTLGEFCAELDNYGEVKIRTGNNACVFRIFRCGRSYMLKCYIRFRSDLRNIYRYISSRKDELFPDISLLEEELYVFDHFGRGAYYDVLCSGWIEGTTLDTEIKRACREHNGEKLAALSRSFDRLALELLSREWAHGDLKPENIIVRPDGSLALIDFDAIYFPGNPAPSSTEVGTPGYQHPARDESIYDKCLDDYPLALISSCLRALTVDPSLYGRYNRSDILLINPAEVASGVCEAYSAVKKTLAGGGWTGHYRLARTLVSPEINLPGLREIFERIARPPELMQNPAVFVEGGLYGFRSDHDQGQVIVDAVFEEALPFREGAALVMWEGKRKLLSARGGFLLGELPYEDLKPLSDGLAAICIGDLWGYVSPDGDMVVEPAYECAGNMHEGYAPVRSGGLWGYIDGGGRPVTGFIYDKAFGLRNGTAEVWKDGEVEYIVFEDNKPGRR